MDTPSAQHAAAGALEAEGGPDQERGHEEEQRSTDLGRQQGDGQGAHPQRGALRPSGRADAVRQVGPAENEQERCHDHDAHGVARPPDRPGRPEVGGREPARKDQGAGARGGTDEHACQRAQEDQRQRVPQPVEFVAELRTPQQQVGADRGDRVSGGDDQHGHNGGPDGDVDGEGAESDSGPDPQSEYQQRGDRDPGRRPQRGDLAAHQLLEQPQTGRRVVAGSHREDRQDLDRLLPEPCAVHHSSIRHHTAACRRGGRADIAPMKAANGVRPAARAADAAGETRYAPSPQAAPGAPS